MIARRSWLGISSTEHRIKSETPHLQVRVINAITGELLRELTIDPNRDYQPRK
jgi:hypothetical protein